MNESIEVRGARQNNLKGLSLAIPRGALVVFTGVSGSGKSSLAYDTIYREAERRFVRSFSTYARQYIDRLDRPDVEGIDGLAPALSIDQRSSAPGPRSTVGTMSEVYDHLRLLYGRVGRLVSPDALGALKRTARLFSFNTPYGACPSCHGLGVEDRVDPELLVADPNLTLREGALVPTTPTGYIVYSQVTVDVLDQVCRAHGFSVDVPWRELDAEQRRVVLYGSDRIRVPYGKHPLESRMKWSGITARPREEGVYKGIVPTIEGILRVKRNKNALRFARTSPCSACGGARLRPEALSVSVGGLSISARAGMALGELRESLRALNFSAADGSVARPILEGIFTRLDALAELGLEHLSLDRAAVSLSPGERNRVRLATLVCVGLSGALFVLDEPSVGLHAQDTERLVSVLRRLRDRGNTVLVVEHDEAIIRAADHVVDLGPAAGMHGGELLFSGSIERFLAEDDGRSVTRTYLQRGRAARRTTRRPGRGVLTVRGAGAHNLRGIDVAFLRSAFNVVTGVSGAGKSTLVDVVLARAMRRRLHGGRDGGGDHGELEGVEPFRRVVVVDQRPIGRTPRSNPATYTKLFDGVRALFAAEPEAERRGLAKGSFSFNVKGGRCERCEGAGVEWVGLHFLPDATVPCPACGGRRFGEETLAVRYHGLDIHQVLALSFDEAAVFFADVPAVARVVAAVCEVGLGYLTLGQPSPTLSGGEAQRVKMAAELARGSRPTRAGGETLYVLDEFTTGLHPADVDRLLGVIEKLVEAGHTVVAVEHDRDVIRAADRVIDLGPGAGADGGELVALGTPEEVARCDTATGRALRSRLDADSREGARGSMGPPRELRLGGVRTHNLRGVDVAFPLGSLTVVTGPSGSGKSSLAFDTLHAEGQRRFAEGLSTYARRHLARLPRPELETTAGIGATVALSQRSVGRSPRSTLATLTDLWDGLRLLFSRAGVERGTGAAKKTTTRTMGAFSFNRPEGACPTCDGLGVVRRCAPDRLVSHPERSLLDGAMDGHKRGRFYGERDGQFVATLRAVGAVEGIDFTRPWAELDERARRVAMFGAGEREVEVEWRYRRKGREGVHRFRGRWVGLATLVDEEVHRTEGDRRGEALRGLLATRTCPDCGGRRLRAEVLAVKVGGRSIAEVAALTVEEARGFFASLSRDGGLETRALQVTAELRAEVERRLRAMERLGLGYLTLDRPTDSLSGGEVRRAQLAAVLGAGLSGVTYVLDEPTQGLHPRDIAGLLDALRGLRDAGNTVVVVEHDEDVIRAADHIIELGPGAGEQGGQVVAQGARGAVLAGDSATARWLRDVDRRGRRAPRSFGPPIVIEGARAHNLADLRVELPTAAVIAVTGVSGSGKTSLVFDVLHATLASGRPQNCRAVAGAEGLEVVAVDRRPLTGGPSRTPASETGVFDALRKLFAATDEARRLGVTARSLSLGSKGARCVACKGLGVVKVEMGFLAEVYVPCEVCGGRRYGPELGTIRVKKHTLPEVLELTANEAAIVFADVPAVARPLATLAEVGLGYLKLGQAVSTLSGGEAQRMRLAEGLLGGARRGGHRPRLYLLDEPTVGLHGRDVAALVKLLHRLADAGHTVVVVEHDRDFVKAADWVVDLGPGAGPNGGHLCAESRPTKAATSRKAAPIAS